MESNEFHWTDGWYFKRNDDGSVRIRKRLIPTDEAAIIAEATIPALEWVSIASHCTAGGESENYEKVKALVLPFKHYPPEMGEESRRLRAEPARKAVCADCGGPILHTWCLEVAAKQRALGMPEHAPVRCVDCLWTRICRMADANG